MVGVNIVNRKDTRIYLTTNCNKYDKDLFNTAKEKHSLPILGMQKTPTFEVLTELVGGSSSWTLDNSGMSLSRVPAC